MSGAVGTTHVSEVSGKVVTNYIDNDELTEKIIQYNLLQDERVKNGLMVQNIPDDIGSAVLKLANNIGTKYNFKNYTYNDEMVADGIVAAVYAIRKFTPEKSTNAFGFLTFVIWRAMVNRIKKEKDQQEIKINMLMDPSFEFFDCAIEQQEEQSRQITKESSIDFFFQGKD